MQDQFQQNGQNPNVNPFADGIPFNRSPDAGKLFLEPGNTFEELLVKAGMPVEDAMDWAAIYRLGITIRSVRLVTHSYHSCIAHAGNDRMARMEALFSITGIPGAASQLHQKAGGGFWSRLRKQKQGTTPEYMAEQKQG